MRPTTKHTSLDWRPPCKQQIVPCNKIFLVLVNCVAPGLLEGTRATANLRPEVVAKGREAALLGVAADKDDCADQVVTMCRTNTMTGQTIVIDAGRTFH